MGVFLPAILKSWMTSPSFVTRKTVVPRGTDFLASAKEKSSMTTWTRVTPSVAFGVDPAGAAATSSATSPRAYSRAGLMASRGLRQHDQIGPVRGRMGDAEHGEDARLRHDPEVGSGDDAALDRESLVERRDRDLVLRSVDTEDVE